jgi:hypothetical protein
VCGAFCGIILRIAFFTFWVVRTSHRLPGTKLAVNVRVNYWQGPVSRKKS